MDTAPNRLPIVKPCPESWDRMEGDEQRRFCEKCGLHVHNLSAMNSRQRDYFIKNRQQNDCIAYAAVADDKILVPEDISLPKLMRRALTWTLALFSPLFGVGCVTRRTEGASEYSSPPPEVVTTDHKEVYVTAGMPVFSEEAPVRKPRTPKAP